MQSEQERMMEGQSILSSNGIPFLTPINNNIHEKSISTISPTKCSPNETENDREANVGPVPLVVFSDGGNSEEDEDEGVAHAAPHLHEVLDCGVGLEGDVGLHVTLHAHGTGNDAEEVKNKQWKRNNMFFYFNTENQHISFEKSGFHQVLDVCRHLTEG